MASPRYFEDAANVDAAERHGLCRACANTWRVVSRRPGRFRYEIRYRRVKRPSDTKILVEYTYTASYKIPGLKVKSGATPLLTTA